MIDGLGFIDSGWSDEWIWIDGWIWIDEWIWKDFD